MEYRTCRIEDIPSAIALSKSIFKENMAEQFLRLFAKENKDRMFIAADDEGTVKSMLCYYPSTVRLGGAMIRVGCIGSVCTNAQYRGKGLASTLLKNAYRKMEEERICVSVISGGGGIYEASGATLTGAMMECRASEGRQDEAVSIRSITERDFSWMTAMNQAETVRFDRDESEFKDLFLGQTYPDTFATYPAWAILRDDQPVAYAIGVLEQGKDELGLKEYAGERAALVAAFPKLLSSTNRANLHFAAVPGDEVLNFANVLASPMTQHASLRLNDPKGFFEALTPLAKQAGIEDYGDCVVSSHEGGWKLVWRKLELRFADLHELNRFVFGAWTPSTKRGSLRLQSEFAKFLPVRFPWTHNLNYQ